MASAVLSSEGSGLEVSGDLSQQNDGNYNANFNLVLWQQVDGFYVVL